MISTSLRVLILADRPGVERILDELRRASYEPRHEAVETEEAFLKQIRTQPDLILAGETGTGLSPARARQLLQESGLNVPFLVLGEEPGLGQVVAYALREREWRGEKGRLEQALRNHEERSRLRIPDSIQYAVRMEDDPFAGAVEHVSEEVYDLLGYRPEEFLRDPNLWFSLIHPEDVPAVVETTPGILSGQSRAVRIYRFRHKQTGDWRWIEDRSTPRFNEAGRLTGLCGLARDITDSKRAEARLSTLSSAVQHSADSVVITTPAGVIEYVNPAFTGMTGYSAEEAIGKTPRILKSGRHSLDFYQRFWQTILSGNVFSAVFINRRRSGELYYEDKTISPIKDGRGSVVRFVSLGRDITERMWAQEQLGYQASLLENVSDAIMATDMEFRITSWNSAAQRIYGWSPAEAVGQPARDLVGAEEPPGASEDRRKVLRENGRWEGELLQRRKDGATLHVQASVTLIRDSSGNPIGAVAVNRDITERRRLEEQLRQSQKMDAVGQLAGGVAHDFNNLLTVMNGYSDFLLEELAGQEPLRQQVQQIAKAGERAAALTRQLLAFGRKQLMNPAVLDLNAVVADMVTMLRRLIGERIELQEILAPDLGRVKADRGQLEQVILNLAINARDAMPSGGLLVIQTANAGDGVSLAVSDTGIGMDPRTQTRIFEPFFTTKEPGRGTGLGLATVYGIVQQSGGRIGVRSQPGKGSTFTVWLPVTAEAAEPIPAAPAGRKAAAGAETILLVEDDETVRKLVHSVLTKSGYAVLPARSGEEALSMAERHAGPIHLLLTDVMMPGMSGPDLARRLAALRARIKVLYMSGYSDRFLATEDLAAPDTVFLEKPFNPVALAGKVRELLDRPGASAAVLVVDDEEDIRKLLRRILEEGGYQVLEAANGREALAAVAGQRVHVVITDLFMPEQEGIETLQRLRRDYPDLKVVAMSGGFGGALLKVAGHLGAHAVMQKPLRPEVVLETVARLVG
ncbi:MAG: PAS domain S-box protein [Candidatus Solibacter usitatus]|nr:PAS domain S-box protein [Candidatus Solibacter usitatus]